MTVPLLSTLRGPGGWPRWNAHHSGFLLSSADGRGWQEIPGQEKGVGGTYFLVFLPTGLCMQGPPSLCNSCYILGGEEHCRQPCILHHHP